MRRLVLVLSLVTRPAPPPPLAAQAAGPRGYHARGTPRRVTQLPELNVTVTRTTEPLARVPFATGVLDRTAIQRGQQTVGIDEALSNIPGVVVANRYNFSLDQRISIRGFGSRSNFGVRGLKILLDGVPADAAGRAEPAHQYRLRRPRARRSAARRQLVAVRQRLGRRDLARDASAPAPGPFAQRVQVRRAGTGSATGDGFYKWQSWTSGRSGSGERHALRFPVQGRRLPAAQRGRDPAAERGRGLRLQRHHPGHAAARPRRQPRGPEPRRPDLARVPGQSRLGGGEQHPAAARTRTSAAAALAWASSTSTPPGTSTT